VPRKHPDASYHSTDATKNNRNVVGPEKSGYSRRPFATTKRRVSKGRLPRREAAKSGAVPVHAGTRRIGLTSPSCRFREAFANSVIAGRRVGDFRARAARHGRGASATRIRYCTCGRPSEAGRKADDIRRRDRGGRRLHFLRDARKTTYASHRRKIARNG
jgi:hypothetical protein